MERCSSARMESRLCTEPFPRISTASCAYKAATLSACPALNSCTQASRSFFIAVVKSSAFVDSPVLAGFAGDFPHPNVMPSTSYPHECSAYDGIWHLWDHEMHVQEWLPVEHR